MIVVSSTLPMLTFTTKKLCIGANGQNLKEGAASFFSTVCLSCDYGRSKSLAVVVLSALKQWSPVSLRPRFSKPIDAPPTPMLPYADLCYQAALLAQMDKLERTEDPASLVSSVQLRWPRLRNQRLNFSLRLAKSLEFQSQACHKSQACCGLLLRATSRRCAAGGPRSQLQVWAQLPQHQQTAHFENLAKLAKPCKTKNLFVKTC